LPLGLDFFLRRVYIPLEKAGTGQFEPERSRCLNLKSVSPNPADQERHAAEKPAGEASVEMIPAGPFATRIAAFF